MHFKVRLLIELIRFALDTIGKNKMNIAAEDQRPRYTASKTIKKTPLSELDDDEMSSSDDDSDEELLPIFANKITKKMKDSEFVRSLQAISDEATPFDLLDSCKEQGNEHYKKAVACLKEKDVLTDPKKKEKLVKLEFLFISLTN